MSKYNRWRRRRAFSKAHDILKKEASFHLKAGHLITFEAADESYIMLRCTACPNRFPQKKRKRAKS